jgi:MoaA/NifB/PqqE/SkfB family radical SAM enzyme
MREVDSSGKQRGVRLGRFIWDLTYACPLRCIHCYSESGRRPARTLERDDMRRAVRAMLSAGPQRISFAGGEPLLVPWWDEAARLFSAGAVPVTVFTGGWVVDEAMADRLAGTVAGVSVSVDGPTGPVHDAIRGRAGSFEQAMASLELLDRVKRERTARGERCYGLGIDYTVTRSGRHGLGDFVRDATSRFTGLDSVRFGAVIPGGLASEVGFVERELLTDHELEALVGAEPALASRARNGATVSVTDVRDFLPTSPLYPEGAEIAQVEPDGELRAFPCYEAKVGNILDEPIEALWQRALAWREDPFVLAQTSSIQTLADWARVSRLLDRRYGSAEDRVRIARRGAAG